MTLGTIEVTMSRVVDVDSKYLVTVAQSVATLWLLSNIAFNSSSQTWLFEYEMMNRDDTSDLNQYKRTLYLKKNGNVHADDHGALSESKDNLLFATGSIRCTMTSHSLSLVQTLRVSIPHTTVKQLLAREGVRTSSAFGKQT